MQVSDMARLRIHINTLLRKQEQDGEELFFRVLHIDGASGWLAVIDVQTPNALPEWWEISSLAIEMESDEVELANDDPFLADTRGDESFSESSLKVRDQRWHILEPVLGDAQLQLALLKKENRGGLISELHSLTGTSRSKLYLWLRQFWQKGQTPNALLPEFGRCGAPGKTREPGEAKRGRRSKLAKADPEMQGMNVTEGVRRLLVKGAKRYWKQRYNGRKLTLRDAYQKTLEVFFRDSLEFRDGVFVPILKGQDELPTLRQFEYWSKKDLDLETLTKNREGKGRYLLKNRPVTGSTEHLSNGPGDLYQIDATVGDIYLVSSIDRRYVVGRPIIYIVVDHWSQMIVGFHVGVEGPSWQGAMMALENAFTEKVSFCKRYGKEIDEREWPCDVYPRQITGDRGEMISYASDRLVSAFNISVANTPPNRPDFKGLVEGQFKLINETGIKRQPGWVDKLKERGGPDYRWDATLDLKSFTQLMIEIILYNNQGRRLQGPVPQEYPLETDRNPTPQDLWEWGTSTFRGRGRKMSREMVQASLLPTKKARATRQGLELHSCKLCYQSATAVHEGWFLGGIGRKGKKVEVSYDPRDVSSIFLRLENGKVEECPLTPRHLHRYAGKPLDEVMDLKDRRDIAQNMDRHRRHQDRAEFNARIDQITERAQEERKEALGNRARPEVDRIRETRREERDVLRGEQAFSGSELNGPEDEYGPDDDEYIPIPD
jgi:hypothetical protein